ncbi:MAG: phosphatase PAP2 family protein [candidate division KSB1 bacterium]|nr:phosphatase PAP2 family protein [candidate division KSB1 bacterium]MDZ7342570.1 phosphatase PAP2 family protein [candidate division KSB1 bacterium]
MKKIISIVVIMVAIWPAASKGQNKRFTSIYPTVASDYKNFYSLKNLGQMVLGLGIGAIYANTTFDREIQNLYNEYIRTGTTDDISKVFKPFGNGRVMVPVYLGAMLAGEWLPDSRLGNGVGDFGRQTSRALLVGVPLVLLLQRAIGASRPYESTHSYWHSFADDNGVSGHSFMGAVPFLVAAQLAPQRWLKYPLYMGSMLTGFSRINDNQHYFSQAFLGWWIAWLATRAINSRHVAVAGSGNGIKVVVYF